MLDAALIAAMTAQLGEPSQQNGVDHNGPADQDPSRRRKPRPAAHFPRLHVRLRQFVRNRSLARRAADRAQLAAKAQLRALRGTTVRLALHRAALDQRTLVALSHSPEREAFRPLQEGGQRLPALGAGRARREQPADRATALGSGRDPEGEAHLRLRPSHDDHSGRRGHAGRHGRASRPRHRGHGERVLLQCGRRAA